jgi:hypothetical protein
MIQEVNPAWEDNLEKKRCANCQKEYEPNPAVKNQRYCSAKVCQKARKKGWQKDKLKTDGEYRENQAAAQKEWREKNPGYWRDYRARHPAYVEENRRKQVERNRKKRATELAKIAKMDAQKAEMPIITGRYRLVPVCKGIVAKMDALEVEIRTISGNCMSSWSI